MIPDDPLDERRRPPVECEGAGDVEWFAGGDVRVEFRIGEVSEDDLGGGGAAHPPAGGGVDDAVTRPQDRRAAAQALEARPGLVFAGGFAVGFAVDVEERVAGDDDRASGFGSGGDCVGLRFGEGPDERRQVRRLEAVLVDTGHDDFGVESGAAQQSEPGGRCRGEHEPAGCRWRSHRRAV